MTTPQNPLLSSADRSRYIPHDLRKVESILSRSMIDAMTELVHQEIYREFNGSNTHYLAFCHGIDTADILRIVEHKSSVIKASTPPASSDMPRPAESSTVDTRKSSLLLDLPKDAAAITRPFQSLLELLETLDDDDCRDGDRLSLCASCLLGQIDLLLALLPQED